MRWEIIPSTPAKCNVSMGVGALLIVLMSLAIGSSTGIVRALDIVVVVCAVAMIITAVIGLISPRSRTR
jgi:hypothetical protein